MEQPSCSSNDFDIMMESASEQHLPTFNSEKDLHYSSSLFTGEKNIANKNDDFVRRRVHSNSVSMMESRRRIYGDFKSESSSLPERKSTSATSVKKAFIHSNVAVLWTCLFFAVFLLPASKYFAIHGKY